VFATKSAAKNKKTFSKQAAEPLQGLFCQNCSRQKVLFA
jgi:hypothetical protein